MNKYTHQIERIQSKLKKAATIDKDQQVFGADRHQYIVNDPVTTDTVTAFEQKYALQLPDSYKAFILQLGNGGKSFANSAAGPFYGIYPFGEQVDELIYENTEVNLKNDCVLHPVMSDSYWENLIAIAEDDDTSDDVYAAEIGKIFGGILPIGSQGCSYIHGLVLNGPYTGKVVNISIEMQKPKFTFEDNFLDWYERWLDEIISKDLLADTPTWFGYAMGGSEEELLEVFQSTADAAVKAEALIGLSKKQNLNNSILDTLQQAYKNTNEAISRLILQILEKHEFSI
ncbi:SMI1/KNR4 family protein [Tenacibaculum amylolyticum]|uniref:SMI1/KNR4 family protein n=1 Tax=Tenacibaculum amylolyticum TaxID=104269 RepID=UPI003893B2F3